MLREREPKQAYRGVGAMNLASQPRGAGAEHCGIGLFQFGYEHFDLPLPDGHEVFLKRVAQWAHEQVAAFGETAEEDECLGGGEGNEIGQGRT